MTPSQQAKEAGLKNLLQVQQLTGVSAQTLTNWHREKPELFSVILLGCSVAQHRYGFNIGRFIINDENGKVYVITQKLHGGLLAITSIVGTGDIQISREESFGYTLYKRPEKPFHVETWEG